MKHQWLGELGSDPTSNSLFFPKKTQGDFEGNLAETSSLSKTTYKAIFQAPLSLYVMIGVNCYVHIAYELRSYIALLDDLLL